MIQRLVLDANVLLSGFVFRGPPHLCLRLASSGVFENISSELILSDLESKLVTRFKYEPGKAEEAVRTARSWSRCLQPQKFVQGVCRDADDEHILDCAIAGRADAIITGDKDLLVLNPFVWQTSPTAATEIQILTPAQLLAALPGR